MAKINTKDCSLIAGVNDNVIFTSRGETIVAFRLEYREKYTLNNDDFNRIHTDWIRSLSLLPKGVIVQKSDWYERSSYDSSCLNMQTYLQRSTNRYFEGREHISHSGYLFLIMPCSVYERSQAANPFRFPSIKKMRSDDLDKTHFFESVGLMREMLERSGDVKLVEMKDDEIHEYQRVCLNGFNRDNLIDLKLKKEYIEAGKIGRAHV